MFFWGGSKYRTSGGGHGCLGINQRNQRLQGFLQEPPFARGTHYTGWVGVFFCWALYALESDE